MCIGHSTTANCRILPLDMQSVPYAAKHPPEPDVSEEQDAHDMGTMHVLTACWLFTKNEQPDAQQQSNPKNDRISVCFVTSNLEPEPSLGQNVLHTMRTFYDDPHSSFGAATVTKPSCITNDACTSCTLSAGHPYLSHSTCPLILDFVVAKVKLHQPFIGVLLQGLTDPSSACMTKMTDQHLQMPCL